MYFFQYIKIKMCWAGLAILFALGENRTPLSPSSEERFNR